VKKTR